MTDHNHVSADERLELAVSVELATPSLKHEWLDNGAIFRTTLHDSTRQTVDQYASRWREIIEGATQTKPIMFLLDISNTSFTLYGRTRSLELVQQRQDTRGYVAIVEKNNIEAQFSQMIVRTMDRGNSKVRLRMFHKMDDAIGWLTQMAALNSANT